MAKNVAQPQDKYVLRLPDGMRDRIKAAADASGRSMNAEIVQALDSAYPRPVDLTQKIIELENLLEALKAGSSNEKIAEFSEKLSSFLSDIENGAVDGLPSDIREAVKVRFNSAKYKKLLLEKRTYIDGTPVLSESELKLPDWLKVGL